MKSSTSVLEELGLGCNPSASEMVHGICKSSGNMSEGIQDLWDGGFSEGYIDGRDDQLKTDISIASAAALLVLCVLSAKKVSSFVAIRWAARKTRNEQPFPHVEQNIVGCADSTESTDLVTVQEIIEEPISDGNG